MSRPVTKRWKKHIALDDVDNNLLEKFKQQWGKNAADVVRLLLHKEEEFELKKKVEAERSNPKSGEV